MQNHFLLPGMLFLAQKDNVVLLYLDNDDCWLIFAMVEYDLALLVSYLVCALHLALA